MHNTHIIVKPETGKSSEDDSRHQYLEVRRREDMHSRSVTQQAQGQPGLQSETLSQESPNHPKSVVRNQEFWMFVEY